MENVRELITNKSSKCTHFIAYMLCFYMFRVCEPSDGSQLIICTDKCPGMTTLYQECISRSTLESVLENSQDDAVIKLMSSAANFSCSDPETYAVPGVPINQATCEDISYIDNLLSPPGELCVCYM